VKRVVIALLVVAVVAAGAYLVLDRPWDIETYRAVDEHTLVVTTSSGWLDWTRVTSIDETPASVVIKHEVFSLAIARNRRSSEGLHGCAAKPIERA